MPTIYPSAASYFRVHPVTPVFRALGEFDVYKGRDVVVKQFSLRRMERSAMTAAVLTRTAKTRAEIRDMVLEMARKLYEQKHAQLDRIKERLGGFVLPFEMPEEIRPRVRRWGGLWFWEREAFFRPIVQRRVTERDLLDKRLALLRRDEDFDGLAKLLDGALLMMQNLARAGFFFYDNKPFNCCLFEGGVMVYDIGAVIQITGRLRGLLKPNGGEEAAERALAEYVPRNASRWIQNIRGNISVGQSRRLDQIAHDFERRFFAFNNWSHVHKLKKAERGEPVPDVFPLTVEESPGFFRQLLGRSGSYQRDPAES